MGAAAITVLEFISVLWIAFFGQLQMLLIAAHSADAVKPPPLRPALPCLAIMSRHPVSPQ